MCNVYKNFKSLKRAGAILTRGETTCLQILIRGYSLNRIVPTTLILVLLSVGLLSSCENNTEPNEPASLANAGEDQTTYAGSYVILDPSQSRIAPSESFDLVKWEQDEQNPQEVRLRSDSELFHLWVVGFI